MLQLLFIKPKSELKRPEIRSLPESRRYLEACIYEMDLKKGKKYHLFLAAQPGEMRSAKGKMARYVMTSPPVLSTKKSTKKISSVTCEHCGKFSFMYDFFFLFNTSLTKPLIVFWVRVSSQNFTPEQLRGLCLLGPLVLFGAFQMTRRVPS